MTHTTPNRWLSLIILLTAPLLSVIDVFIINVAIPSIRKGIHGTDAEVQLVIAGYLLGYAAFLITGGRAGDIFGRKKIFMTGMLLFTLVSCLCGLSQNAVQLNTARFFQGISAAFMVPQTISYIQVLFPEPAERTKAVGLFGITLGMASIIGQFMGGYFSDIHGAIEGWRYIFFINLPIGLIALFMAGRFLRETSINREQRFDYTGVLILTAALVALIYPLIQGSENGWPLWSILTLIASFGIFILLIRHQQNKLKKGRHPLIHTALFSYADFNLGLLAVLFFFMVHSSYLLISTVYMQDGLGLHAFATGQAFVFMGIGFTLSSILSVRYVIRYGKSVLQFGVVIMMITFAMQYTLFRDNVAWSTIIVLLFLHGFGSGMVLPSLLNMALKSIPVHHAGAASGVYSTFQQAASALGVSIIGSIFFYFPDRHIAFQNAVLAEMGCLFLVGIVLYLLPEKERSNEMELATAFE